MAKTRVDFDFTANLRSLRAALSATLPHVASEKDAPDLSRLRLFVTAGGVFIAATDRFTMALARVHLEGGQPSVLGCVDLPESTAKLILKVFRPASKDDDPIVQVQITEKKLTVTDVSGMFPGTSLTLVPTPAHPRWPDLGVILGNQWAARGPAVQLPVSGEYLARFAAAARAYGDTLLIEPATSGRALVISCGESFVGALMCRSAGTDQQQEWSDARSKWFTDLAPISQVMPDAPPDPPVTPDDVETEETIRPVDLTTLTIGPDEGDES